MIDLEKAVSELYQLQRAANGKSGAIDGDPEFMEYVSKVLASWPEILDAGTRAKGLKHALEQISNDLYRLRNGFYFDQEPDRDQVDEIIASLDLCIKSL